ncbi:MAG: iron-sulfur cluster insertion protein ErpA [Gammaproteobacteria bacterium]
MNTQTFHSIQPTPKALERIITLSAKQKSNQFRIYVTGGGCSGFQYGFKFDEEIAADDDIQRFEEIAILVDALSYPYLYGSKLDFVEDLGGSRFIIENPNAKTTCGCGESFAI